MYCESSVIVESSCSRNLLWLREQRVTRPPLAGEGESICTRLDLRLAGGGHSESTGSLLFLMARVGS